MTDRSEVPGAVRTALRRLVTVALLLLATASLAFAVVHLGTFNARTEDEMTSPSTTGSVLLVSVLGGMAAVALLYSRRDS